MVIAGSFDVEIALGCFILFFILRMINSKNIDEKIITRTKRIVEYIAAIPVILVVLYFAGITINWTVLLIGLAWRFWLLVMALPYIIAAFRQSK
jgi:hypothetical protein